MFQVSTECATAACRATGEIILLRPNTTIYSAWTIRRSDNMIGTVDVFSLSSANLTIKAITKNWKLSGNGLEVDASTRITLTGPTSGRFVTEWGPQTGIGLRELVRFQFACTPVSPTTGAPFAIFRMLDLVWFDTVATAALA